MLLCEVGLKSFEEDSDKGQRNNGGQTETARERGQSTSFTGLLSISMRIEMQIQARAPGQILAHPA